MVKSNKRLIEDSSSSLSGTEEESISEEEYNSDEEYETPFRSRIRFTAEQTRILEEAYQKNKKPSTEEKQNLADQFDTVVARIKVWFQNRRAKEKRTNSSNSRQEDSSSHSKSPSQQARKREPRDKQQQPSSRRSMTGDSVDGPVPLRGDVHQVHPPGGFFYRKNPPHYGAMKYVDPFPVNSEMNYYPQHPLRLVNPQATLQGPYDFSRPPLPYPHPHLDATLMESQTFEADGDDTLGPGDFHQQSQGDDDDFPHDMSPLQDEEPKPRKGEYML